MVPLRGMTLARHRRGRRQAKPASSKRCQCVIVGVLGGGGHTGKPAQFILHSSPRAKSEGAMSTAP